MPALNEYDHIIVMFSGGKDSAASFLHLIDQGVDLDKVELWHHNIDGSPDQDHFMDWEVTPDYCRKFAEAFGVPIYFSWRQGGFHGELMKENDKTKPVTFQTPDGWDQAGGVRSKVGTRRMFPAKSANLQTRWCSGLLKIDVADLAINNQDRFQVPGKKTLVITGERAEESANRATYAEFEPHRTDNRDGKRVVRYVDHWRPVLKWEEAQVWDIMERHSVNPHPAYWLGFGRTSCAFCIFGSKNQWATLSEIMPDRFDGMAQKERDLDHTIDNTRDIETLAKDGQPFEGSQNPAMVALATQAEYDAPIFVDQWELPAGAYGENCGAI